MNKNLKEDVFDTVLSSAFAEYAESELESYPSKEELDKMFPVPKDGLRRIKRSIKKNRPVSKTVVYVRRVAIVFLAAIALFAGLMATSTEVRGAVSNAIVELFDKFARLDFGDEPDLPVETKVIENVGSFEIGYIPEGLELIDSFEDEDRRQYMYSSPDGCFLVMSLYSTNSAIHSGDLEMSVYRPIMINSTEGHIFYNDAEQSGSLVLEIQGYTIMLSCILDKTELIKIAENIK